MSWLSWGRSSGAATLRAPFCSRRSSTVLSAAARGLTWREISAGQEGTFGTAGSAPPASRFFTSPAMKPANDEMSSPTLAFSRACM